MEGKAIATAQDTELQLIGTAGSGDPCVVLTGGVHGNEPAGVEALEQLFAELPSAGRLRGTVIGLRGNPAALRAGVRALDRDLNRVWSEERVRRDLHEGPLHAELGAEALPFHALNRTLHVVLGQHRTIAFIDLHTTSADTAPFITMNDTLANRRFVKGLQVPVVLGIEEHLQGPMLSWLMERGQVAMAFESGRHDDPASTERHLHFAWLALERAGCITLGPAVRRGHQKALLTSPHLRNRVFDIRHRQALQPGDRFTMNPGFSNFQPVQAGQPLAEHNGHTITCPQDALLFMPLYQAQGGEGFFLVRPLHRLWLALSAVLRNTPVHGLLRSLPGVDRLPGDRTRLLVDTRVARSRALQVFHLLGYRLEREDGHRLCFIRRERRRRRA
jgi:succinylglutamate desuccinylase